MERIPDVNMEELNDLIATEQANAQSALWGDDDLTARIDAQGFDTENPLGTYADKRMRSVVAYFSAPDGSWQPTALKQYDHVMMLGIAPCVVAMPARGRDYFLGYAPIYYGAQLMTLKWDIITDRAPEDAEEDPMPINALPPTPPETPEEGEVRITIASHAASVTATIDDEGTIHTTTDESNN